MKVHVHIILKWKKYNNRKLSSEENQKGKTGNAIDRNTCAFSAALNRTISIHRRKKDFSIIRPSVIPQIIIGILLCIFIKTKPL